MNPEFVEYLAQFVSQSKLERFDAVLRERTRHLTVVLEDVHQRQNVSACLRSCECFGVQDVHIIENAHRFRVNSDIARGAAQWLTLHRHRGQAHNTLPCVTHLKERGYRIVATAPGAEGCLLADLEVEPKTALVFGAEKEGVSPVLLEHADALVQIPMQGFTGSLNLSVAAALCLYELTQKLRRANVPWRLTADEQAELRAAWVRLVLKKRFKEHEETFLRLSAERLARPEASADSPA